MNERQQTELRALQQEQQALKLRLGTLEERLARFEAGALSSSERPVEAAMIPSSKAIPPALPSVLLQAKSTAADQAGLPAVEPPAAPPPFPPMPAAVASSPTAVPRESLEVQIGTVWLVRVGIVLVLTALVFFGTYLYENIIPHLEPAAKITLLYLGAGTLTGVGAWLERSGQARAQPRLQNYAQVLFAGGLSAVYYVTYAAHYFENLRVIPSALLAGALLLAWTAFMVFLAHRRGSETLATVAILLAYYTAAINDGVAGFTLISNLGLTGGVVFLLRRHLWKVFPFASLLATFGSYAFWTYYHSALGWRGFDAPPLHANHGPGGFWIEASFLCVYWALFTWVVFTSPESVLPSVRRAGFAGMNNSAFYLLVTWLVLGEGSGWFWEWSLGFGVVLLALAEAGRRSPHTTDARMANIFLFQGVLTVTTGLIVYFAGWQLAIVLATETVALLAASRQRRSQLLLGCSLLTALLAFGWTVLRLQDSVMAEWLSPFAVGALLIGAAALAEFFQRRKVPAEGTPVNGEASGVTWFYALLGVVVWEWLIGEIAVTNGTRVLLLMGAALAMTASVYALRVKALPVYAQGFLAAALLVWGLINVSRSILSGYEQPSSNWTTLGLLVTAAALGQWWRRLPGATLWRQGAFTRTLSATDAVLATAGAWLDLSLRVDRWHTAAFTLAAAWSLFAAAVFVAGLLLHDRVYRWLGLLIMAATLGHVGLYDIMGLDTLGKAISLFALAVVLLGVGFLYNRYRDKIRDLL